MNKSKPRGKKPTRATVDDVRPEQLAREIRRRPLIRPASPLPSHATGPANADVDDEIAVHTPDPNPGLDGFK